MKKAMYGGFLSTSEDKEVALGFMLQGLTANL